MNLSRFISVMKFRPLVWRSTHPYVLVDRVEVSIVAVVVVVAKFILVRISLIPSW
jgi:hypothetical protein